MLRVVKKSYDSDPEYDSEYESTSYDMVTLREQDLNETYVEGLNDGMIQAYSDVGWEILKIPLKFETELSIQEWIRCNIDPLVDGKRTEANGVDGTFGIIGTNKIADLFGWTVLEDWSVRTKSEEDWIDDQRKNGGGSVRIFSYYGDLLSVF
ncbi:hypothetical protein GHT06_001844 [Daphnia sinensis]|uniref:Uncharacterized protein n=1 Tax=Daphnia sinensis TaxID=1820382 RepID=A0AAD5KDE0_9CRUS|nr:hypothetical protein GHT06_001844 [Daphnia sinensis]